MPLSKQPTKHDNDLIDYTDLIKRNPWVTAKNQQCIVSPDSDGFLCGLLVTNFLNWEIVGFYDGKILILKQGIDFNQCVFLDVEINRRGVRSIGNHMVEFNRGIVVNNHNFGECIQPNILRNFDGKNAFQRKYPLLFEMDSMLRDTSTARILFRAEITREPDINSK